MAPRFEGLSTEQWSLIEPLLPSRYAPGTRGPGKPPTSFRNILNTILWMLFNGAKWKDIPRGPQWAPRSTSHRWLGTWERDGTWRRIADGLLAMADQRGLIDLLRGSVDGMFVAGKGGGDDVAYGFKGKGVTLHHLVDNNGRSLVLETTPANIDERQVVESLLDSLAIRNGRKGRPRSRLKALQGDKGYQDRKLHARLRKRGIAPRIARKEHPGKKKARSAVCQANRSIQS